MNSVLQPFFNGRYNFTRQDVVYRLKLNRRNFRLADMSNLDLTNLDFSMCDFVGVNLSGTDFTGSKLIGANLKGANTTNTIFDNCDMRGVIY